MQQLFLNFYNNRQCIEATIRTEKGFLNIKNLRTRDTFGINTFLYLAFMTDIGIRNIIRKLMDVPAKISKYISQIKLLFPAKHYYAKELLST